MMEDRVIISKQQTLAQQETGKWLAGRIIYIYNQDLEYIGKFDSIRKAGKYSNIDPSYLYRNIDKKKLLKNKYYAYSTPIHDLDISKEKSIIVTNASKPNISTFNRGIPIFVYDSDMKFIIKYASLKEASVNLNILVREISGIKDTNKLYHDKYYFFTTLQH